MNPALPEILRGKPTELPRQISFSVFRDVWDYWLSSKTSFFLPFNPIHQGIDSRAPKTECKYEGLMAEMQIEKDFRSELVRNFHTKICLQTNLLLIIN